MTRDEIRILLNSQDFHFRRAAIDDIVMSFPIHADLFFSAFHQDKILAEEIANAAKQWMPALMDGYDDSVPLFISSEKYTTFRQIADSFSIFLHEMSTYLQSLDPHTAQRTKNTLWFYFPGIRSELENTMIPSPKKEHRQLMVFVTGRCNLHCPYCFSKEIRKSSISKTDMQRVLSWAKRQYIQTLLPCGGEPLLYEHMDWLIQEVEKQGMKIYFATNLSVPLPYSILNNKTTCIDQLHVHLTDDIFQDEHLMTTFLANLRQCRSNGIDIILRGNICNHSSTHHYDEWFRIAKEFAIEAINVAFTIPSHVGSNRFVQFEAMQSLIPQLRYIWELGIKNSICVSIAKPVPLCLFPEDFALEILKNNHRATYCNISEDDGMHNLSLSNDMYFSPCLGVDSPSVVFDDNLEWNALRSIFGKAVRDLQSKPLFKHCTECFLYDRKLCQGACLSYKQASRNGGVLCGE